MKGEPETYVYLFVFQGGLFGHCIARCRKNLCHLEETLHIPHDPPCLYCESVLTSTFFYELSLRLHSLSSSILMILLVFILNFHFLFKSFTWRRLSIFLLCPSYFRGQNLNFPHDLSHLCCKSMFIISIFHLLCMPPAAHFTFSFVLLFIQKI